MLRKMEDLAYSLFTVAVLVTLVLAVTVLLGCSTGRAPTLTVQAATNPGFGAQWAPLPPPQTKRIMLWGGTEAPGIPANTMLPLDPTNVSDYFDFPKETVCWDTFQVGSKGRGPVASYLIVAPQTGVGIAIRDDVAFQRPRLCTQGIPKITLINNWDANQVMTFFIEGDVIR